MSAFYEGCWHKLGRAKHHLDELDSRAGAWANLHGKPPIQFGRSFDAKRDLFTFHVVRIEVMPVEWSLIAGDALTNFRAALDYLAHDLIGRGSAPHRKGKSGPQFTIGLHRNEFINDVVCQMPGIKAAHRTIIEDYQPYTWDKRRDSHPLALLRHLVNRDRHRELQLVTSQHIERVKFRAQVIRRHDFDIRRVEPGRVFGKPPKPVAHLKPNAEVARVFGKKTGRNPDVDMSFMSMVAPAFESGEWLTDTLQAMDVCITKLFREIEPKL